LADRISAETVPDETLAEETSAAARQATVEIPAGAATSVATMALVAATSVAERWAPDCPVPLPDWEVPDAAILRGRDRVKSTFPAATPEVTSSANEEVSTLTGTLWGTAEIGIVPRRCPDSIDRLMGTCLELEIDPTREIALAWVTALA
jgi:hypothetical protein